MDRPNKLAPSGEGATGRGSSDGSPEPRRWELQARRCPPLPTI